MESEWEMERTQVIALLEVTLAVIVAGVVLGENWTAAARLGGVIILLGVWFVNRPHAAHASVIEMLVVEPGPRMF